MNWVEALNDPTFLASILLAGAAFATVLTIFAPLMKSDKLAARMKSVGEQRSALRRRSRAAIARGEGSLRHSEGGVAKNIVSKLNLSKLLQDGTIDMKLAQAGLRGKGPRNFFYVCRAGVPFVAALVAGVLVWINGPQWKLQQMQGVAIIFASFLFGFYLPNIYVTNRIAKRKQSIMRAFPDSLDMLLICVEAGMTIEIAMGRVGQEIGAASVELAEELQLCTAELSYLPDRRSAYENLARRTDHPGVKAVAMALVQAERYGTPLGQALRVMAKENRDLRMNEAEKKAAALPAQLTVPMIAFFLPVLCAIILAPAMIQVSAQFAK
ncbi:MAG: type II secretion system F family protein [Caulobacterales bacterium]